MPKTGLVVQPSRWPEKFIRLGRAANLIEKESNVRRTSNIERPTSNIVFCPSKASKSNYQFKTTQ